jgi:MFS transporter, PAT family, beta-lactamase induction signal transducer AmpG
VSAAPPTPAAAPPVKRPGTWKSLVAAARSWRTLSVALLSFSSGLPLGLVWVAIPDWLRSIGVDIRVVGLITLAQAPWTFKFLWSPLLDRYRPPGLAWLGRRRGWAAVAQVGLFVFTLALAGVGSHPQTPWVVGALALAIAFSSASQDIAVDAYAVDVLRPEEQGIAVGARIAVYRAAMFVASGLSITLAAQFSWPLVDVGLACLYLPMLWITFKAPEPEDARPAPRTLTEAVWHPFLGFLARHRALEILAFVFFYKLADNLADALKRPFLVDMGYTAFDRGVALATVGLAAVLVGTFLGGAVTTLIGLGHSLWLFGVLMVVSNLGYILVAAAGHVDRPLMYAAIGFETLTQGLGTGAFSVLLLRITQKRFSATQYALFSSLFGLPRVVSGPIAGFTVYAVGWKTFFWLTMVAGIPGLVLLARFVPLGTKEPSFTVEPPYAGRPLGAASLAGRGLAGAIVGGGGGAAAVAFLAALEAMKGGGGFDLLTPLAAMLRPETLTGWLELLGLAAFGAVCGLFTAAVAAARHGAGRDLALDEDEA